jgi:DNA-directed RNA polymerase subunit RPC12/RpoP
MRPAGGGGREPIVNAKTPTHTPPSFREGKPQHQAGGRVKPPPMPRGFAWGEIEPWRLPVPGKRCRGCHLYFEASGFRPNPRIRRDGLHTYCRGCERKRRAKYDPPPEARRLGPFPVVCSACGGSFEASRRMSVRCPECQAKMRAARKRPSRRDLEHELRRSRTPLERTCVDCGAEYLREEHKAGRAIIRCPECRGGARP